MPVPGTDVTEWGLQKNIQCPGPLVMVPINSPPLKHRELPILKIMPAMSGHKLIGIFKRLSVLLTDLFECHWSRSKTITL